MSWDDEAVTGSMGMDDEEVLLESWDAEEEPIMESWDAEVVPKEETKPKSKASTSGTKNKNGKKSKETTPGIALDALDPKMRRELLKKAELESDLSNAADLLGSLDLAEEHPRARQLKEQQEAALLMMSQPVLTKETEFDVHPLFQAETKKDYQDLRKALSKSIVKMHDKSPLNYSSSLAIDLIRDVAKPMSIESIRQTVATLNVLIKEKEKEERQARLARVRGGTATGGAGKKKAKVKTNLGGAFKKDQDFDLDDMNYDNFGDDDFM
ncbi:translation initiation factor eIF3 core subunit j NDAI_0E04400 [Naumovozyma dairenensis CBS 421]|uniref:Eukaryotic translation initiation factor 3 subunit J n=1 Tax=Naumovozyma dairenensis (strain ATCC 10597 / BCRC 20456 / CBS 421 / NBRC 0211 / NRRL Y-12639) TaxID=1071378 RepID=G0WBY7_NAUDC|nr:hypothetical protein NDAI_0E04400 [Naumovozyma dairenensis CBS 421]CCD25257.1 hypothetical protein NDAI_0E04400 [Naumovozyma dairenensis CBS 421]